MDRLRLAARGRLGNLGGVRISYVKLLKSQRSDLLGAWAYDSLDGGCVKRRMLRNEAKWIGDVLSALPLNVASPCLNLGSSTESFRKVEQPYIEEHIIAPGEGRGMRFIHADVKKAPGVDIAGDIFDPQFQAQLAATAPGSVLCCNMFEHVTDRPKLAEICKTLVRPGGYIIVTVPKSFPYHVDPIDTYFRPAPADIVKLFSDCELVMSDVVLDKTYWQQLLRLKLGQRLMILLKTAVYVFLPFYQWERWKGRMHRLSWLFRPYKVSVVVFKRVIPCREATKSSRIT